MHAGSSWINWQFSPYGQNPNWSNLLHRCVLYFGCCWRRHSSCDGGSVRNSSSRRADRQWSPILHRRASFHAWHSTVLYVSVAASSNHDDITINKLVSHEKQSDQLKSRRERKKNGWRGETVICWSLIGGWWRQSKGQTFKLKLNALKWNQFRNKNSILTNFR